MMRFSRFRQKLELHIQKKSKHNQHTRSVVYKFVIWLSLASLYLLQLDSSGISPHVLRSNFEQ